MPQAKTPSILCGRCFLFPLSNLRAIPPLPRIKEDIVSLPALETMREGIRQIPVAILGMLQDEAQTFLLFGSDRHDRPHLGFHHVFTSDTCLPWPGTQSRRPSYTPAPGDSRYRSAHRASRSARSSPALYTSHPRKEPRWRLLRYSLGSRDTGYRSPRRPCHLGRG